LSVWATIAGWLARHWWKVALLIFGSAFAIITLQKYYEVSEEVSETAKQLAPIISTIMVVMMLMIVLFPVFMMFQMFIGAFRW